MPQAISCSKLLIKSLGYAVCFSHSWLNVWSLSPNNSIFPELSLGVLVLEVCLSLSLWEKELVISFLGDSVLQVEAFTQAITKFLL